MGLPINITNPGSGLGVAGAVNSYAALQQHMTAFELKKLRDMLGDKLLDVARNKGIGSSPGELTVRDIGPNRDLAGGALTPNDDWVTAAATVANAWYTAINAVLANNKAVVIYGFWSRDAVPNIVRVRAQSTGGGTTYLDVDVSAMYSSLEQVVYFSTPIFYGPTNTVFITYFSRIAALSISGLLGMVVEPQGEYLSRSVV